MTKDSGNKFRVFVSHKHDDHALAEAVKTTLEGLSGRTDCFVSSSDLSAGSDWNAEIRSQLAKSHLLIRELKGRVRLERKQPPEINSRL